MGRRSRKRSVSDAVGRRRAAGLASRRRRPAPPRLSSEERNAQLRAKLSPLESGERPRALVAAAATATFVAVANVVLWAAGFEVDGKEPALSGVLLFAAIMLVAAWGMWTQRYWAVLGFQSLLAITIVVAALSLLVASNIARGRPVPRRARARRLALLGAGPRARPR